MPIGRIQLKHGLEASADFNSMLQAEAYYATDTERLMISNGDGTGLLLPSKPELDTIQDDVDTLANNLNLVQLELSEHVAKFEKSLSPTGYQKLPSGLIEQWGTATIGPNTGGSNILFATPFPTAALNVQVTPKYESGGGSSQLNIIASSSSFTTTGFYIYLRTLTLTNPEIAITVNWRALGY